MAKIRLRFGINEVEIESRDFYIDNDSVSQVISDLASRLQENSVRVITEESAVQTFDSPDTHQTNTDYLKMFREAEVHEPEFTPAVQITVNEIPNKIESLEKDGFFDRPRTVLETVEQLRQNGWITSPLDVSKTLAKMAFHKELAKSSEEKRTFYFREAPLLT